MLMFCCCEATKVLLMLLSKENDGEWASGEKGGERGRRRCHLEGPVDP